jgi:hypothetical protein
VIGFSDPRLLVPLAGVAIVVVGTTIVGHWTSKPNLAKADYVGTIDVSADDARLYREVPFEWRVTGPAGAFTGIDKVHVRIDSSGERAFLCGWLTLDKAGASTRASRWLSEARLKVDELELSATFIAPSDKMPGDGLHAGCARLDVDARPAADAPLAFEGAPVPE